MQMSIWKCGLTSKSQSSTNVVLSLMSCKAFRRWRSRILDVRSPQLLYFIGLNSSGKLCRLWGCGTHGDTSSITRIMTGQMFGVVSRSFNQFYYKIVKHKLLFVLNKQNSTYHIKLFTLKLSCISHNHEPGS